MNSVMDVSREYAQRDLQGYRSSGITHYIVLGPDDIETCPTCEKLNNLILPVSNAVIGINFPPFHDGCRCSTGAHFDDMDRDELVRQARDPANWDVIDVPDLSSDPMWQKYLSREKDRRMQSNDQVPTLAELRAIYRAPIDSLEKIDEFPEVNIHQPGISNFLSAYVAPSLSSQVRQDDEKKDCSRYDLYIRYIVGGDEFYRSRDTNSGSLSLAKIEYLKAVRIFTSARPLIKPHWICGGKQCPALKQLAIIYEKEGDYQSAADVCSMGIKRNIGDGTKSGFTGRKEKLLSKLQKSQSI